MDGTLEQNQMRQFKEVQYSLCGGESISGMTGCLSPFVELQHLAGLHVRGTHFGFIVCFSNSLT